MKMSVSTVGLLGVGGGREEGESPCLAKVPVLWADGHGRTAGSFPLGPRWASKSLTPHSGGWTRGSP
jgi:prepilin-type processing-associated H-X9-DG protein